MLYDIARFWGWMILALLFGLAVGFWTWSSAPRSGWLKGWALWGVLAFILGVMLALFHALPGRAGLWLETALLFFVPYIFGCFVGGWVRSLGFAGQTANAVGGASATTVGALFHRPQPGWIDIEGRKTGIERAALGPAERALTGADERKAPATDLPGTLAEGADRAGDGMEAELTAPANKLANNQAAALEATPVPTAPAQAPSETSPAAETSATPGTVAAPDLGAAGAATALRGAEAKPSSDTAPTRSKPAADASAPDGGAGPAGPPSGSAESASVDEPATASDRSGSTTAAASQSVPLATSGRGDSVSARAADPDKKPGADASGSGAAGAVPGTAERGSTGPASAPTPVPTETTVVGSAAPATETKAQDAAAGTGAPTTTTPAGASSPASQAVPAAAGSGDNVAMVAGTAKEPRAPGSSAAPTAAATQTKPAGPSTTADSSAAAVAAGASAAASSLGGTKTTTASSSAATRAAVGQGKPKAATAAPGQDSIPGLLSPSAAAHPGEKPASLTAANEGKPDDLRLIKGIGPKNEASCNAIGVYHFSQIATWSPENAIWAGHHMAFPGRIEREHWIRQAQLLAAGVDTAHSTGVKSGAIVVDDSADAPLSDADASALRAGLPAVAPGVEGQERHRGARPLGLVTATGGVPDNLQLIKGIGKQNEARLHGLGIWHFDQIATWSVDNVKWVGSYLAFPGRIDREKWIVQAAELAAGHKKDFAKRAEAGLVKTSAADGTAAQTNSSKVAPRASPKKP